MGIATTIGLFIERLVTLVFAAAVGGIAGLALSGGDEGAGVAGAAFAVFAVFVVRALRSARGARAKRGGGPIGTLVAITREPPPGAPWYHHTYVLVDVEGKRQKLKLSPKLAQTFSERFAVGDVGRIVVSGKHLADFVPASPAAPLREKTNIRVFVSYAHDRDRESQMAEYVAEVFETAGLVPWLDRSDARPGLKLRDDLAAEIRRAHYFVPLLSPEYMASDWCLKEFEAAAQAGIRMKPVKISEGRLVPPPYLKKLYDEQAGEPVYLDMTSRDAPARLRALAEDIVKGA